MIMNTHCLPCQIQFPLPGMTPQFASYLLHQVLPPMILLFRHLP
ncbi:unnamed protein product [Larinioides sclopetarius]|uniref:Uncharacterized protein n=1 Tax=Larinioides sclopetarius TaxID=280406 RepID=A0AAV2BU00_9ARAC